MEKRYTDSLPDLFRPTARQSRADGQAARIEGYAAVFFNRSDPDTEFRYHNTAVERISRTAFDRTLREHDQVALWDHKTDAILARKSTGSLELSVDSVGLRYSFKVPDTTLGRDLYELVRNGIVTGASFGFRIDEEEIDRSSDGTLIRTLTEISLLEVSPTSFPAYKASTTEARSFAERVAETLQQVRSLPNS